MRVASAASMSPRRARPDLVRTCFLEALARERGVDL
jgi:hypothetical protein